MKKRYFLVLFMAIIFSSCINNSPSSEGVTIELYSPDLPDTCQVYLTGSIPALGNWNPSAVQMQKVREKTWRFTLSDKIPELIEYKFTLGSWEQEASGANGLPLQNFVLKTKGDTLVKHDIYFWLNGKPRIFEGRVIGNVKYHENMQGNEILERTVVVLLPADYEQNTAKKYPVLYMHDGQNLFDPQTSSFGVDWQIDETLDSLAKIGEIEIPIVVGIYNTRERTEDYTPGRQNKKYMQFVVETVKPYIDKNYRTKTDRMHTSIGGSSYGGLVSFMLAWEYPQVFSKAFCLSPAFKVGKIDYVENVMKSEKKDLKFYIDNGGIGLEEQLQPGIDDMLNALQSKGYRENIDFFWILDKEARHFESDWAYRMPKAFQLMFSKEKKQ